MTQILNLDLLSVAVAVAGMVILGALVFFNDRNSASNKSFLYFSVIAVLWGIVNYISYKVTRVDLGLIFIRLVLFFATFLTFFLFRFLYVFPRGKVVFPSWYKVMLNPLVICTALITISPLVANHVTGTTPDGAVSTFSHGIGIFLFAPVVLFLIFGGIWILSRKTLGVTGASRRQYLSILTGFVITFVLLVTFNFILPAFFNNSRFIPLGAVFLFPFIAFTSYAIIKRGLFDVKVVTTEILTFVLAVVTFIEIIFANDLTQIIFRSSVFILVLVFGILLIKGVRREIEQREKIQILAGQISVANSKLRELDKQKTEFLSIASHQLRSPLTAIKGYSSLILENSFGETSDKVRGAVDIIFQSSQRLVTVIEDFLNVTRIELGKMKYEVGTVDMKQIVETAVKELGHQAELKGLTLKTEIPAGLNFQITGDGGKLAQVIGNLIDNAIKYTKQGSITVALTRPLGEKKVRLAVTDTGVGMSAGTHAHLFEKFTRAQDAGKTNIIGTGLGLFVAKQIVEAHHGKIWAESPGPNKGSTFYVEI